MQDHKLTLSISSWCATRFSEELMSRNKRKSSVYSANLEPSVRLILVMSLCKSKKEVEKEQCPEAHQKLQEQVVS